MKIQIIGLIFGIGLFSTLPKVSAETIKMIYGNLPPYMYLDDQTGKAQGASVAYFDAMATQVGHTVEWVGPLPQVRFLSYLKTPDNEIEGAISILKYKQTEEFLEFPDMPYFLTQPSIAVRYEDPLQEIHTLADLQNYSIGGMAGEELPIPFDTLKIEPLFEESWVQQNLKKLVLRRVDAVFSQEAFMLISYAKRLELSAKIKLLSLPVDRAKFYVAFRKASPQSKRLVEQYNAAVKTLQINFEELLDKELAANTLR